MLKASGDPFLEKSGARTEPTRRRSSRRTVSTSLTSRSSSSISSTIPTSERPCGTSVRYVMVDEYQDTNYIQERLLDRLSEATGNLCVVGDEDQALYRWRGATVRNILEFPTTHPGATVIKLTTNYRSHEAIVHAYDRLMAQRRLVKPCRWSTVPLRQDDRAGPGHQFPDYPAVFSIWGATKRDEATRFADLVKFLADNGVIEDYSQVALLLHSVRIDHSGPYLDALERAGIPYFCPRARAYFENEEVRAMVACLAVILGWYGDGRGTVQGRSLHATRADGRRRHRRRRSPVPRSASAREEAAAARGRGRDAGRGRRARPSAS